MPRLARLLPVVLVAAAVAPAAAAPVYPTFAGGYRTVAAHEMHMREVAAAHPDLASLVDIGDSWLRTRGRGGADILAVCLTRRAAGDCARTPSAPKPRTLVVAGIHARELVPPEVAWSWIDHLVDGYGSDPQVTALMDTTEMWVVPMLNPDGRAVVERGGAEQRKNGNDSSGACATPPTASSQFGVDLNRNFSYTWGGPGSSSSPCDLKYRGTAAAGEPETRALQALADGLFADRRGPARSDVVPSDATGTSLSIHSYGGMVLYPWGDTTAPAPNVTALRALALRLAAPTGFRVGQPPAILATTSGDLESDLYGRLGVAALATELASTAACPGFAPPFSCVASFHWPQQRQVLTGLARAAASPYRTSAPPNDPFAAPTPLTAGGGTLSATNVGATRETGEPAHAGNSGGASVWFTVTPSASGAATIETAGSGFDTLLAVYRGTALSALTTVASNDDVSSTDRSSRVRLTVSAGVTYRIAVDGYGGAQGGVTLRWTPPGVDQPPSASFSQSPVNPTAGQVVTFTDTSTDAEGPVAARAWDLDDDGVFDDGTGTSATRVFAATGLHTVRLRVTDSAGAVATATRTVSVSAASGGVNLVVNPSFEGGLSGWGAWQATLSRLQVAGAPDGVWVARVTRSAGTSFTIDDSVATVPSAAAGATYTARVQVRAGSSSSIGKRLSVQLRERRPDGTQVRIVSGPAVVPGSGFQPATSSITPTTGNAVDLYVAQSGAVAGDSFDIDAVSLTR